MTYEKLVRELEALNDEVRSAVEVHARPRPDLLKDTFPEQRSFIEDQSPLKAAFCTRRGAKSYSTALDILNDSFDHPYAHYLILGLHRPEVKDIYWDNILKTIDRKYDLGAKFNESELTMRMPNGALVRIAGADANEEERRKFLGGKKRKIAVDEAQSWGTDLEQTIMGVLKPSVADYNGQVIVVGTPGNLTKGFFARITKGCRAGHLSPEADREPGWSVHTWTTFENTAVVDGVPMRERWRREIEELKRSKPLVIEVPWFRQNYLGEWVVDLDALCYRYNPVRNAWNGVFPVWDARVEAAARARWHYVLAIDLGYYPDPSAFSVLAYHDFDPCLYVVETWKQWRMDITSVAQRIKVYEKSYKFDAYVIDGSAKQAVEEMRQRHNLPLLSADKAGKSDFIELLNAEMVLGNIKVNEARCNQGVALERRGDEKVKLESLALVDEWAALVWDPKKLEANKREEHPSCPNHLADTVLYGWRHCYQYLSKGPVSAPLPFTPEWFEHEVERMREQAEAEMNARKHEGEEDLFASASDPDAWEPWAR